MTDWDEAHADFDAGMVQYLAAINALLASTETVSRIAREWTLDQYIAEGKAENPARWLELNAEWAA